MAGSVVAPPDIFAVEIAPPKERLIEFSIEAAPLALVVRRFALKTGISVSYEPATVRGKMSPGLTGRYSPAAGLSRLLDGTAIVALVQANGDYVLRAAGELSESSVRDDPGKSSLPSITVKDRTASFLSPISAASRLTAAESETPRTMTVIPAELIRATNASSLADVLRTVPGISFRGADALTAPAGDRPYIRGFDSANSMMIDGMRSSGPQGRELFAIEQVEVIEGPASVYGGRASGGGNINLISKVPGNENRAVATTAAGTANLLRQTVDLNRVLTDDVAARLNLMWQSADKAGRRELSSSRWGVAPSVTFGMLSPTRLTLGYYHLQSNDIPDYSVPYARGGGAPLSMGSTPFYGLLARDYLRNVTDTVQADYRQRIDDKLTLRNLTQYSRVRQSFIATNPQWANMGADILSLQAKSGIFDVNSVANQTELTGTWGDNEWVAGLELSRENGTRDAFDIRDQAGNSLTNGASCAVPSNCTSLYAWNANMPWTGIVGAPTGQLGVSTKTDAASLYLLDTFRATEKWLLSGGGRFDYFRTRTSGATQLAANDGSWNYQLGAVYKLTGQTNLYASLSTSSNPVGADAGTGVDSITNANQDLAPEHVRNLEIGIKLDNAEHTLSATLAAFRSTKRNARISVSRDAITGARQSIRGVEASIRGNLTPSWKIFGGISYLDSAIDDGGTAPVFSGRVFPMVPRRSASVWSTYRFSPTLNAGVGATYSDRVFANASNSNYVPAYTKFDSMVAYEVDQRLELQLNFYNLTNKRYYDVAYPIYATIAPARSAVLSARIKF